MSGDLDMKPGKPLREPFEDFLIYGNAIQDAKTGEWLDPLDVNPPAIGSWNRAKWPKPEQPEGFFSRKDIERAMTADTAASFCSFPTSTAVKASVEHALSAIDWTNCCTHTINATPRFTADDIRAACEKLKQIGPPPPASLEEAAERFFRDLLYKPGFFFSVAPQETP